MFDLIRTAQATACLLRKHNGRLNYTKLIKLMYLADREAINELCIPITGDDYYSMKNGPVGSRLLELIKGKGEAASQKKWDALFKREDYDIVAIKSDIPRDWLSDCEIDALNAVNDRFGRMDWRELVEWTHNPANCPEWRDPQGGRLPITKTDIMSALGFSDEAIESAQEDFALYEEAQKSWELLRESE